MFRECVTEAEKYIAVKGATVLTEHKIGKSRIGRGGLTSEANFDRTLNALSYLEMNECDNQTIIST